MEQTSNRSDSKRAQGLAVAGAALGTALLVFALLQLNGRFLSTRDSLPYRYLPAALLQHGTFRLDAFPQLAADGNYSVVRDREGHLISKKPVLPGVLVLPAWVVFRTVHGRPPATNVELMEMAKAGGCLGAALAAAATFLLLRAAGLRRRWIVPAAAMGMVFLTPFWFTAMDCWPHPLLAALNAFSLWLVLGRGERLRTWFWVGLMQGAATAARLGAAPVALVFMGAALAGQREMRNEENALRKEPQRSAKGRKEVIRDARRLLFMLAGMMGPLLLLGLYNAHYFGSPFAQGFGNQAAGRIQVPWAGVAGLLASPAKGIFIFSPVLLLAVSGLFRWRRPGVRFCAAATSLHLLFWASYADWLGGWGYGPRYLADVAPFLTLLAATGLDHLLASSPRRRFVRAAVAALAGVSLLFQLAGMFMWDGDYHRVYDKGFGTGKQGWVWRSPPEPLWLLDRRVWYEPFFYRKGRQPPGKPKDQLEI